MELLERAHVWEPRTGKPIELTVTTDQKIAPKDGQSLTLIVPGNTSCTILEEGEGAFTVDLVLQPNSSVKYYSDSSSANAERFAYIDRDASIWWVDVALHGATSTVTSYLAGQGADAEFRSVFLGRSDEKYDVKSRMIHVGSKSTSNMLTRAVLFDTSKGNYEGLIKIDEDAKGCDAYQKEETLLLSKNARMDATPNLEISNEDVRCSHGVSLGQIDEEKLFYLTSRGLNRQQSVQLIITGFFADILDNTPLNDRILARVPNEP